MIYEGDRVDSGKDEVLGDFICEGFDCYEEDIGFLNAGRLRSVVKVYGG